MQRNAPAFSITYKLKTIPLTREELIDLKALSPSYRTLKRTGAPDARNSKFFNSLMRYKLRRAGQKYVLNF